MSNPPEDVRLVSLENLRRGLGEILGRDSLIFRRFERAFIDNSPDLLDAAVAALKLYPAPTQAAVDDLLVSWLFGANALPETPDTLLNSRA
ncbi:hypothetical protein SAMN07250955_1025 [Arboricoccus pini]|uniref:Uncharacterized protein n=1 Tax=Arboricoccus pini TaxID=1963835 RepID=A0A212QMZ8_9PROT|nr:hypothetical protein [Arboricoccus pini]SNB60608.1 hypothetical protein SAMN07250955_1025 [Arboricoccus pini]